MRAACVGFLIIVASLALLWWSRQPPSHAPGSLAGWTLICTVCAKGVEVPSFPVTFAATFKEQAFLTASAPATFDSPPPPVQQGLYKYRRTGPNVGSVRMLQSNNEVTSTLRLHFTHASGGTLEGNIYEDNIVAASQVGSFALIRPLRVP